MSRSVRFVLVCAALLAAALLTASPAGATITPAVTLSQTGTAAGSTQNVTLDIKFSPSSGDSPKDMTVKLPAGLLANASIDGGACLTSTTLTSACQIGSGTVTASEQPLPPLPPVPLSISATFYLVPPPHAGDLAGVQAEGSLLGQTFPLGSPADVTVRPASDAAGVGLNEVFSNLPNTDPITHALPITIDEIDGTFTGLRLPASCPSTPANVAVIADSYAASTPQSATAPLHVDSCGALPYSPKFTVTAAKDSGDAGTQVVTDITQAADEASSSKTALAFPASVLAPNAGAIITAGIQCTAPDATFSNCKTIGSASSTSPLYPQTLIGKTYLTGPSLAAPAITIRFPAPFALTLSGTVNVATNTTTFSGLPDIPLTDLKVTLNGGPDAAFAASCNPANGTATSTLTTQNGDRTVAVPAAFTVSGCVASTGGGPGSTGPPTGPGSPPPTGPGQSGGKPKAGAPTLSGAKVTGLGHRRPVLTFTATAGRNAPKLRTVQLRLPRGLRFMTHRVHGHTVVKGASASGARIATVKLSHGRLLITLRTASGRFTIRLSSRALAESKALAAQANRHKLHALAFALTLRDARGKATSLTLRVKRLRL